MTVFILTMTPQTGRDFRNVEKLQIDSVIIQGHKIFKFACVELLKENPHLQHLVKSNNFS